MQKTVPIPQSTINIAETIQPPSQQTNKPKKYLFAFFILFIFLIVLIYWSKIYSYKISGVSNTLPPTVTPNQEAKSAEKPITDKKTFSDDKQIEVGWTTHTDNGFGFSFMIPDGWNFVSGRSSDSVDFDIVSPNKEMFVGIAFYTDKRVSTGMSIADVMAERENDTRTNEGVELTDFKKYVKENEVGYLAKGKIWYLNFANENAWEESDGIIYDFEERVSVKNDGKITYLQSMVLPGSSMNTTAAKIIDSFVLK
jgi:hypothetical protein